MGGEYISLQEAAKYCNYTQEYLSLRARQGKLKAVKFGRNWVTKKEWLEEYLRQVEEYKNNLNNKKVTFKIAPPPENLPIEREKVAEVRPLQLRPGFVMALAFVLLFGGLVFGKDSFQRVFEELDPYLSPVRNFVIGDSESLGHWMPEEMVLTAISLQDISRQTLSTFKEFGQWLNSNIKNQISKIKNNYFAANDFIEKKIDKTRKKIAQLFKKPTEPKEEKLTPRPTKEGMVVIPSSEKDEQIIQKIKVSFSDEVKVEPKDEISGIISPVFREREGEKYLYILVPIETGN